LRDNGFEGRQTWKNDPTIAASRVLEHGFEC